MFLTLFNEICSGWDDFFRPVFVRMMKKIGYKDDVSLKKERHPVNYVNICEKIPMVDECLNI
jgi:hypothetical protein